MNKKQKILLYGLLFLLLFISSGAYFWYLYKPTFYLPTYEKITQRLAKQGVLYIEDRLESITNELMQATSTPGIQRADVRCNDSVKAIYAKLSNKVSNISRVNKNGTFVCSVDPRLLGYQLKDTKENPYQKIYEQRLAAYASHTIQIPYTKVKAQTIQIPIYVGKEFAGSVGASLYLKDMYDLFVKDWPQAKQGSLILFDDNGDILYHPQQGLIGKNFKDSLIQSALVGKEKLFHAVEQAKAGQPMTTTYTVLGVRKVATIQPVNIASGRRWVLVATLSY